VIVGVDMGGTFTDVCAFGADGVARSAKAPTTADGIGGVLAALREVVEPAAIESLAFGSTVATNALAARRLARTGLLTTAGFRDVLDTRRLWRPELFGHAWERPPATVPRRLRLEARERIGPGGELVAALDEADVERAAAAFADAGVEAVAVAFLFAHLDPVHERRAREILQARLPGVPVLLSSDVNPERKEYERTSTTAIAAGLAPIVDRALRAIESTLAAEGLRRPLRVMKSNGGVMSARAARAKPVELVKSGPAGGAAAGVYLADALGEPDLILLDIGGTTADASLIRDGRPARAESDAVEWDIPIRVPVVDIRSIGAGGGSIAWLDPAGGLRVGPHSAGAEPGPAAYGRGGTRPTVTDAAVVAGLIDPARFLGGRMALDAPAARASLAGIAGALGGDVEHAAAAVLHLAASEMAALVREITVERGFDPRDFVLVPFGGAGPLFAGALLDELGLQRVVVPAAPATLSAFGGAFADVRFDYVRSESGEIGDVDRARLDGAISDLLARADADMREEGFGDAELAVSVDLRYAGQRFALELELRGAGELAAAARRFEAEHERLYGHRRPERPVELVAVRVRASATLARPVLPGAPATAARAGERRRTVVSYPARRLDAAILRREALRAGFVARGPLIVEEDQATTVVLAGQELRVGRLGVLEVVRG
jgi:N-methylhydantoinase A/oxoprolinase/acetone carboxylase beta subunit